jgi:hypothetical protein
MLKFNDLNLDDRYELIASLPKDWQLGIEIGVWQGWFLQHMIVNTGMYMIGIDPYIDTKSYADPTRNEYNPFEVGPDGYIYQETRYISTWQNINQLCGTHNKATLLRAYSYDVKHYFQDESIDFVYIDGEHTYKAVAQDIDDWWPKVKRGGILSGHDYNETNPGSIQAVDEFSDKIQLDFQITGTSPEKGDADAPSWIFIKE